MSHRTPENAYELRNPGQASDAAQRALLTDRLAKAEHERRKLLDAYYGGAIDVPTLKAEQSRIGTAIDAAKDRLADLDANLTEQQEILDLAASLATRCGDAYRKANDRTRKLFNAAVFECLDVKGGRLCHEQYRPPFDGVFAVSEFEYGTRVGLAGIEPATSALSVLRSNRLSYSPNWENVPVRLPLDYFWTTPLAIVRPHGTWSGNDDGATEGFRNIAPESVRRSRPRHRHADPGEPDVPRNGDRGPQEAARLGGRARPGQVVPGEGCDHPPVVVLAPRRSAPRVAQNGTSGVTGWTSRRSGAQPPSRRSSRRVPSDMWMYRGPW